MTAIIAMSGVVCLASLLLVAYEFGYRRGARERPVSKDVLLVRRLERIRGMVEYERKMKWSYFQQLLDAEKELDRLSTRKGPYR